MRQLKRAVLTGIVGVVVIATAVVIRMSVAGEEVEKTTTLAPEQVASPEGGASTQSTEAATSGEESHADHGATSNHPAAGHEEMAGCSMMGGMAEGMHAAHKPAADKQAGPLTDQQWRAKVDSHIQECEKMVAECKNMMAEHHGTTSASASTHGGHH